MPNLEEIDLNITNRCNIGCSHCFFSAGPKGNPGLPLSVIQKALKDGQELGVREVHVTGGEPLVRKDFVEIMKIASSLGYFVRLQTNLWGMTTDLLNQIKKYTKEISTTVDGLEDNHDLIRRKGSFKRTIKWIKILLKEGFRVVVITAIQRKNYDDVIPLVDYLVDLGVNAHFLFIVGPAENVKEEDVITLDQWRDLILKLRDKFGSKDIKTDIVCQLHNLGSEERIEFIERECRLDSKNHAVITVEGNVFPCSMFINSGRSLDNIKEDNLANIWKSSPVWNFYNQKINDSKCLSCHLYCYCHGGCRAYSYESTGDISRRDPRCGTGKYPICPLWKLNVKNLKLACATWRVMRR